MTRAGCVARAPGANTAALPPIRYSLSLTCTGVYSSAGCGSFAYFSVSQRPGDCCAETVQSPSTRVLARAAVVRRVADVMMTLLRRSSRLQNPVFDPENRRKAKTIACPPEPSFDIVLTSPGAYTSAPNIIFGALNVGGHQTCLRGACGRVRDRDRGWRPRDCAEPARARHALVEGRAVSRARRRTVRNDPEREVLRDRWIRLHATGRPAAAARCEQGTVLQLSARARVRVRPGAGQVDEEEEHSRCGASPGAGGLQRKDLHL